MAGDPIRWLADENLPLLSVDALLARGVDITSMSRLGPGTADPAVLGRATVEDRILVTFDRNFGDLIFAKSQSGHPGVVYLRSVPTYPTEVAEMPLGIIERQEILLHGMFTVIDRTHLRQRPLPARPA